MPPKPKPGAKPTNPVEKAEAKPADLAKEVRKRTATLITKINAKFDANRKATVTAATAALKARMEKKAKGGKIDTKKFAKYSAALSTNIPVFKMEINMMRVSCAKRSGTDQGWLAIKGWSRTCRSAHMMHAALHVNVKVARGSKSKDIGLKDIHTYFPKSYKAADHVTSESWAIMSFALFKSAWETAMANAKLADYTGKTQKFQPKDPWHVELPTMAAKGIPKEDRVQGSRPSFSDKEVIACIDHYAEYAAFVDAISDSKIRYGHKKNTSIEKNYPKTYKRKYGVYKAKLDAQKKQAKTDKKKADKLEADIVKKVKSMKSRMNKTYKEIMTFEKENKKNGAAKLQIL